MIAGFMYRGLSPHKFTPMPGVLPSSLAFRGIKMDKTQQDLQQSEQTNVTKEFYKKQHRLKYIQILLPGRVSRIHLYEAKERYITLSRILEYYKKAPCKGSNPQKEKERQDTLDICEKILDDAKGLLTRRQDDLNYLWRELTRVRIMLLEKVFPDELLPTQLDSCREEAHRLAVTKDPEVNDMLQRLAEVTQEQDQSQNRDRMFRAIRALLERFNTIRTGRIHQQFVNIRTYLAALLILIPISILLIANADLVLGPEKWLPFPPFLPEIGSSLSGLSFLWKLLTYPFTLAAHLLKHNILAFVFFGGLVGGFFSVVIRLRNQDLVPGEDAYFIWYVLSKPFVGALGAVILFMLFQSGMVSSDLLKGLTKTVMNTPGPEVFGFAFLSGFSERIVFPEFR